MHLPKQLKKFELMCKRDSPWPVSRREIANWTTSNNYSFEALVCVFESAISGACESVHLHKYLFFLI